MIDVTQMEVVGCNNCPLKTYNSETDEYTCNVLNRQIFWTPSELLNTPDDCPLPITVILKEKK